MADKMSEMLGNREYKSSKNMRSSKTPKTLRNYKVEKIRESLKLILLSF